MQAFLYGSGVTCAYFAAAASFFLLCRRFIKIPDELFRKTLHFVLLASYIPFVFAFDTWYCSAAFAVLFEIIVYPLLAAAERLPRFSAFVTERKHGEFKNSLLLAFSMLAVCVCICWGLLGDRHLVLACMYAWGVGDAFAALIGKSYGRHKIRLKLTDGKKSVEGSCAMFVSSALTILTVLLMRGGLSPAGYAVISAAGAAAAALVEMISRNGMDTVTCPAAAMAVILPLTALFGGCA